jgi:hypothetical protein
MLAEADLNGRSRHHVEVLVPSIPSLGGCSKQPVLDTIRSNGYFSFILNYKKAENRLTCAEIPNIPKIMVMLQSVFFITFDLICQ